MFYTSDALSEQAGWLHQNREAASQNGRWRSHGTFGANALAGKKLGRRRLALVLEYDGSDYRGFQYQRNAASVQKEIERALDRLTGEEIRVRGASRTDAGVHAKGQVVAFDTDSRLGLEKVLRGLNFYLPESIVVVKACQVEDDFHPRRWAVSRHYRYIILERSTRSPLWKKRAWQLDEQLDTEAMCEAGQALVGTRSVAPFTTATGLINRDAVRTVHEAQVARHGEAVYFDIRGESFLPQQIRRSAWALGQVGRGELAVAEFKRIAIEGEVGKVKSLAPAHGLYLVRVEYPGGYPS
ncbi:MAG: tRNA pseudouridine(38-40) synthase TruA [Dehalococcoidia bacterium]|nr:tRNA pseudouridine(38-40) synthase TruA [Dehalococcoidia bacterium]